MKITKTAGGKKKIKISKKEWESIGKKAGWMKEAGEFGYVPNLNSPQPKEFQGVQVGNVAEGMDTSEYQAEILGEMAFKNGKEATPSLDQKLMELLKGKQTGESAPLLEAWLKGWSKANLA